MCGIAGILRGDPRVRVELRELEAMRDALRHRGPDDSGVFAEGRCGLAHTRLSILDLSSRARQPMTSPSGRYVIVFNGEIYNYRELRERLLRSGRAFQTTSDTEVILHLMEEGGLEALDRLRGMFAIALFDRVAGELHLIRDRLGIKPLFWVALDDGIAFASEPKALAGLVRAERPAAARVAEFLAFRHLAEEESPVPGIRTLQPGHRLCTDGRAHHTERWWAPEDAARPSDPADTSRVVRDAVVRQLVSDVPVGTFLSGGVDSALVTAFAADALRGLDTFTVGFAEQGWDETERARVVSQAVGAKAHELRLEPRDYIAGLARATWHLDAPLNHAHSVHLLELARLARRHVTVVLTGEGSDELFAGYPRYRLFRIGRLLGHLPDPLAELLARRAWPRWPRVARLVEAAHSDWIEAAASNAAFASIAQAARLAGVERPADVTARRRAILEQAAARGCGTLDALFDLERRTYLVSLLQRMDRMTMAVGLEARVPLLDEAVLDFSLALPARAKLGYRDTKRPMRAAAAARFGAAYAHAPKFGFGVPVGVWLRGDGPLAGLLERLLGDGRSAARGWIDVDLARTHLTRHRRGAADCTEILWGILSLELWARICIEGDDAESALN
jgi:asparagine synthase (glutamine-hydrolysing)